MTNKILTKIWIQFKIALNKILIYKSYCILKIKATILYLKAFKISTQGELQAILRSTFTELTAINKTNNKMVMLKLMMSMQKLCAFKSLEPLSLNHLPTKSGYKTVSIINKIKRKIIALVYKNWALAKVIISQPNSD